MSVRTDVWAGEYCVEGCGCRATHERPNGVLADGTPGVELVCPNHDTRVDGLLERLTK